VKRRKIPGKKGVPGIFSHLRSEKIADFLGRTFLRGADEHVHGGGLAVSAHGEFYKTF
jgi:hypothetical protein